MSQYVLPVLPYAETVTWHPRIDSPQRFDSLLVKFWWEKYQTWFVSQAHFTGDKYYIFQVGTFLPPIYVRAWALLPTGPELYIPQPKVNNQLCLP